MEKEKRIIVNKVSKKFKIGYRKNQSALERFRSLFSGREPQKTIEALEDVSFQVDCGEILGIIGNNGSGKSTLLRIIAGIYKAEKGGIITRGKIVSLINLAAGLINRLTMRDNINLCCSLFGLSRKETKKRFSSILEFSGFSKFDNTKVYQFSEGMKQRLTFSIAVHCDPEILLLDEVFEVGDEEFKEKSAKKIKEIVKDGCCVVLVSHDMRIINKYCDRVSTMDEGVLVELGKPEKVISQSG